MYKFLAILLLPLLMALPISDACRTYFFAQNCQLGPNAKGDACVCFSIEGKINTLQDNLCCCAKDLKDKENVPLLSDSKPIELNLTSGFEFTEPIDLAKKINIIENYTSYFSAGISTSENLVLYSPPIYQQYCSLRI
jgi:hypothetical protein